MSIADRIHPASEGTAIVDERCSVTAERRNGRAQGATSRCECTDANQRRPIPLVPLLSVVCSLRSKGGARREQGRRQKNRRRRKEGERRSLSADAEGLEPHRRSLLLRCPLSPCRLPPCLCLCLCCQPAVGNVLRDPCALPSLLCGVACPSRGRAGHRLRAEMEIHRLSVGVLWVVRMLVLQWASGVLRWNGILCARWGICRGGRDQTASNTADQMRASARENTVVHVQRHLVTGILSSVRSCWNSGVFSRAGDCGRTEQTPSSTRSAVRMD
jgi:hypothetical protein